MQNSFECNKIKLTFWSEKIRKFNFHHFPLFHALQSITGDFIFRMSIMTSPPASIASPGRVSGVSPTVPLIPRSFLVPVSWSWCARTQNGISGRNSWTWYKISEARIKERSHLIISFELSRIRVILQDRKLKVFRFSHSSTFHFFPMRVTFSGRLDNFILHEWFIFLSFISLLNLHLHLGGFHFVFSF